MDVDLVHANLRQQIQDNEELQAKYDALHLNYNKLQSNYDNLVDRITQIEQSQSHHHPPETANDMNSLLAGNKGKNAAPLTDSHKPLIRNEISEMKADAINASTSISELQRVWSYVDSKLHGINDRLDALEQYLRLNSLLIHGLDDIPRKCFGLEFSKYVMKKLKELLPTIAHLLNDEDISVSHPLPTKHKSKTVVIVKFVRRDIRNLIFYEKREIKKRSSTISITEHLTSYNSWLMDEARKFVGFRNVWSSQCTVVALVNGRKVRIKNGNDLNHIYQQSQGKRASSSYADAASAVAGKITDAASSDAGSSDVGKIPPSTNKSAVYSDPRNTNTDSILSTLANLDRINATQNNDDAAQSAIG